LICILRTKKSKPPVVAAMSSRPAPLWARASIWTSVLHATRSTPASRRFWIPAAVSSASISVSVLSPPRSKNRQAPQVAMSDSKKALRWGAFFVAWLLVAPALADTCGRVPGTGEPVVSRYVIDGDTLELSDGRRVRLIGINTPEIGRKGRPSEPYAQQARAALEQRVARPNLRLVVGEQARDHYGRTLGHLFDAQGVNVEAQLLREGMGFAIGVPPNLSLLDCHLRQEAAARGAGAGLWRQDPVIAAGKVRDGGFHLVRGQVRSIERTRDHLWVEL